MAGRDSEDIELLLSPNDIPRGRRRRGDAAGYQSEGVAAATTDWLNASSQTAAEDLFDSHHCLSDHALPSERARIAASNRYRELQRSGRQELSSSETTPLLGPQTKESILGGSPEPGEPVLLRVEEGKERLRDSLAHESLAQQNVTDLRSMGGGGSARDERKRLKREK